MIGHDGRRRALADSKNRQAGQIDLTPAQFRNLVWRIRSGKLDLT